MIPVSEPLIGSREIEYVNECLQTGWISSAGRFIEEFESRWAEYCGVKYGVAVANGTVALQVAVECIGLSPGIRSSCPHLPSSPAHRQSYGAAAFRFSSIAIPALGAWM